MSTAFCYLDPARGRPNLTIQANALTECLLIEDKRCTGVRYTLNGQQHEARATREVIVSGGSINSRSFWSCPVSANRNCFGPRHRGPPRIERRRRKSARSLFPRMKWTVPRSLGFTYNDKGRGLGLVWQL